MPRAHRRALPPPPFPGPAYVEWIDDTFNLRQCQCLKAWRDAPAGSSVCRCDAKCPPKVDPTFLTEGAGQSLCSLELNSGYRCYAQCKGEDSQEVRADDTQSLWLAGPSLTPPPPPPPAR